MSNSRSRTVTVSSIVGRKAYQCGVIHAFTDQPFEYPVQTTRHQLAEEWHYERGRQVGTMLKVKRFRKVPKNRIGPKVSEVAINLFREAQEEGYIL